MSEPDWVEHAVLWHLYPLGFLGAEPTRAEHTGEVSHRLPGLVPWLDHAVELGASGILLGPVFDSVTHGYDTTDHLRVDSRLGDNADLVGLIAAAHERGLVLAELLPDDLALRLAYTLRGLASVVRVEMVEPLLGGGTRRRAIGRVRHSAYPYLIRGSTAASRRSEMRLPIINRSVVITSRPRIT